MCLIKLAAVQMWLGGFELTSYQAYDATWLSVLSSSKLIYVESI